MDDSARIPAGASDDDLSLYLRAISAMGRLTHDDEIALGHRIAQGDERALHRMVEANLRLVVSVAKWHANKGVALPDLIQEGNIGLMQAARKFDPTRGFHFSTYAVWWIRQAMTRAIANQRQAIRIPVHVAERLTQLRREEQRRANDSGAPDAAESRANAPRALLSDRVIEAVRVAQHPLSLESTVLPDGGVLNDALEDTAAISPFDSAENALLRAQLLELLRKLPERERSILVLRYGLRDGRPLTLSEVSSRIGLTRERVRQIEHAALARLRSAGCQTGLHDYLEAG